MRKIDKDVYFALVAISLVCRFLILTVFFDRMFFQINRPSGSRPYTISNTLHGYVSLNYLHLFVALWSAPYPGIICPRKHLNPKAYIKSLNKIRTFSENIVHLVSIQRHLSKINVIVFSVCLDCEAKTNFL